MKKRMAVFMPHAIILLVGVLIFLPRLTDLLNYIVWWLFFALMGVLFLPVTDLAFGKFKNGGYMFSKALCLAAAGYLQWLFSSLGILPFRVWSCILMMLILATVNFFVNRKTGTWGKYLDNDSSLFNKAMNQEALFMALLLFWTYLRALKPELDSLEKFMDFGFVNSILRSDWLPAPDMWLAGNKINYYYLGHFITAFVTRLTFIDASVAYNLMMATLFALAFMLAYSIGEFLIEIYENNSQKLNLPLIGNRAGILAGIIAGLAVCFAGNLHTLVFAILFPQGNTGASYWFPDATRYIGYNPDVPNDKTIHEFPFYSFVVSDLHAHVINILFVLTVVGLVIALAVKVCQRETGDGSVSYRDRTQNRPLSYLIGLKRRAFPSHISFFLIIFLIGLFPAINFWDYPIYIVFTGAMLLYANLKAYDFSLKSLLVTIAQIITVAIAAYIVTIPFQLSFDSMGTQIKLVEHRTPLYQLGILWGCQLFFAAALVFIMIRQYRHLNDTSIEAITTHKDNMIEKVNELEPEPESSALYIEPGNTKHSYGLFNFIEKVNPADALVFIIFICAVGLIIIPELIYVADIYLAHPRANTMFKVGYQAFILFGLGIGYTLVRMLTLPKNLFKFKKLLIAVGCFLLASTLLYPFYSITQWYFKHNGRKLEGLDGTTYMLDHNQQYKGSDDETYSISLRDDYSLIRYINGNITGSPVIAEASGESYTMNGRISANTGLPDIMNWYTHQTLWRNSDNSMLDERIYDLYLLYESGNPDTVREVLEKYNVEYIIVGEIERLRYPDIDEALLQTMGDIAFRLNDLYMIHVK